MARGRSLLTLDDLREVATSGEVDTVVAVFPDLYGRLMGKRFDVDFFLSSVLESGTHACNYLLTVDMEMEPVPGYEFANWETGYGDFHLTPELNTLRRASWLDRTAIVVCDVRNEATHDLVAHAPRSLLKKQIERAQKLGYTAMTGSEIEYYIFSDSFREGAQKGHSGLQPAGWYIEDYHILQGSREESFNGAVRRHLRDSGIPVESSKGEWGLGQHELNVAYAESLAMADRHVLYKQCLKEVAEQLGISVTFMAKYDSAGAGSSCHVHLSLWKDGRSAFAGDQANANATGPDVFRWFLGGWMAHVPDLMAFYAPNVNSYKRYKAGSWAPTHIAWSHDNRTAGFRIVGRGESRRIECRIPGADCNPYLVYAAALASGLDGIENRIEPPAAFQGDVYSASRDVPQVPATLNHAIANLEKSRFARSAFGQDVVSHYLHFFRTEQEAYDSAVTDWERRRYFERIEA